MPPTNTMLVGISMSMPRQSRQLTAIAGEIENNANAQHGTVRASINYFKQGKLDGLKTLKVFQGAWKSGIDHYARYPFAAGMKLLPAALVEQAVAVNEEFRAREAGVREAWLRDEYPGWLASAPERMGSLYDPADFPSAEDCMNRFRCEVVVVPLAESEQWQRIAVISPDLAASMASQQNETTERVTREAHARLWQDVMAPIQNIVDQLSKDKGKVYDSLIGNVISVIDLVPAYNDIHKDQNLTAAATAIKAELCKINPEDLRKSAEAKADALKKAQGIIQEYGTYARSFNLDDDEPTT
jgi:hypothetical protein